MALVSNNAGIMFLGITEAFSVDQAHEQMNANYYCVIRTMQAVLPAMRKAGSGLIINTRSLVGRISPPFFGTYTATKHALEGYSQALRYEVAPFGVDIAIVEPGPFGTGLLASGRPPALGDVLAAYGALAGVPTAMGAQFAQAMLDAAIASAPGGKKTAAKDYIFLLLFEQRQNSLALWGEALIVPHRTSPVAGAAPRPWDQSLRSTRHRSVTA